MNSVNITDVDETTRCKYFIMGALLVIPVIMIAFFVPSSYFGGFMANVILIYLAWYFYFLILSLKNLEKRKLFETIAVIVLIVHLVIAFVYIYVTGRPYGKPGDLKNILYVLASALPVSLIIFDRSKKQIFSYISVVLTYLLEIPIYLFSLWRFSNFNILKHLGLKDIMFGFAVRLDSIIIGVLMIIVLNMINKGKQVKTIFFFAPFIISYLWSFVFSLIKDGLPILTEGTGREGFIRCVESCVMNVGFCKFTFAIAMICIYNRMKMREENAET
ncbi:MAG: hypothetical protein IKO84_01690 [Butyrivibrio sp.]|nr:hypothetical protein [Butyrivibrio sp.]